MGANIYANITQRGTKAAFAEAATTIPQIWPRFAQTIPSDGPDEEHVWLGQVPNPREYLSGRTLVGIRDFTYNIANKEYELSFVIDQTSLEDDRHGLCNRRIQEAAQIWTTYKDVLFASLMNNGTTTGNNSYDAVTFFNDSHVIGSATPDNKLASTLPLDAEALTDAEMQVELRALKLFLQGAQTDTGQEGYNWPAMGEVIVMGNQQFEKALRNVINSSLISTGGSNPYFENMADVIINPYLAVTNDYLYMAAVGDKQRMPIIYQERTPLQVNIYASAEDIAKEHGLLVLVRQRFRMWYGEPRRMVYTALS